MNGKLHFLAAWWVAATLMLLTIAGCAPLTRPPGPFLPGRTQATTPAAGDHQTYRAVEDLIRSGSPRAPEALQAFIARFPTSEHVPEAWMHLGDLYQAHGDLRAARESYHRLLADHPGSPLAARAELEVLATFFKEGDFQSLLARSEALHRVPLDSAQQLRLRQMRIDSLLALGRGNEAADEALAAWLAAGDEERPRLAEKLALAVGTLTPEALQSFLARPVDPATHQLFAALAVDRYAVGCLLPLSGAYSALGQKALRGIEMALARFGADGGAPAIRLVVEDTGSRPEQVPVAVEALAKRRVVAILGPMATSPKAAAEAQALGIPIVTFTQREGITDIGDYVFRNFITARAQTEALARWAMQRRSFSRFAILYPADKYGRTFSNWFTDMVVKYNGQVVGAVAYDPSGTDFSNPIRELARLRNASSSGFEALFIPDEPAKAGLILPQLAFHDVTGVVPMGTNLWQSSALVNMAEYFVDGAVFPTGFFEGDPDPAVAEFVTAFRESYGQAPGFIEAVAHDTAMILFTILKRPEIRSRRMVRDALAAGTPHIGLTGETLFGADGEARKSMSILTVRDGTFQLLDRIPLKSAIPLPTQ